MNNVKEFFQNSLKQYKDEAKAVGWGSKESQEVRFDVLIDIGTINKETILDVGCGLGDFYGYLEDNTVKYTGYDILEEMISAAKKKYPKVEFTTEFPDKKFDYVFASGVFNIDTPKLEKIRRKMIYKMWEHCNVGMAVNFLSVYAKNKNNISYYTDPIEIIKYISLLTNKWVVRHDYKENDFTIYAYR